MFIPRSSMTIPDSENVSVIRSHVIGGELLMLSILLVDDHEVVRKGLREILEEQPVWKVCGEASNGREAVARAVGLKPRVAIVDLEIPQLNGLEATRQIKINAPEVKVLVYSVHESD